MRFFFLSFSVILISCFGLENNIDYKKDGSAEIKKLQVFAERHSGSNFVKRLLADNFPLFEQKTGFCHKHFPPWVDVDPQIESFYEDSEQFLCVVVFRNPYDYLRGMNRVPWHGHQSLFKLPFSTFIKKKWMLAPSDEYRLTKKKKKIFLDKNPNTGGLFNNVIELRTAKIKQMLQLKNYCHNIYYVNYETILKDPEGVLSEIAELFDLEREPIYKPVKYYKGNPKFGTYVSEIHNGKKRQVLQIDDITLKQAPEAVLKEIDNFFDFEKTITVPDEMKVVHRYLNKGYPKILEEDLDFINSELCESLEKEIGYDLVRDVNLIK